MNAVRMAILLTPLDRYAELPNHLVPAGAYIVGAVMVLGYYFASWRFSWRR